MKKIFASSLSQKFAMTLAGLFLLVFLPVHLGINLLLLKDDPEPFNRAAEFMAAFPLVKAIELLLITAILVHVSNGIYIQIMNWLRRPVAYSSRNRSETAFFSRFMIWTGSSVLIFLILHFFNFYFMRLGLVKGNPDDFYSVAHELFKIPVYNYIYLVCFSLLGLHLYHAIISAARTLGLSHRIWAPVVQILALVYALVIPFGFGFISVTLWQFR